jgi:hypothetical protein
MIIIIIILMIVFLPFNDLLPITILIQELAEIYDYCM